jgi:hypothetical protein
MQFFFYPPCQRQPKACNNKDDKKSKKDGVPIPDYFELLDDGSHFVDLLTANENGSIHN